MLRTIIIKSIMEFNKDNFQQEVEENKGLVLVDFFAPWCGPCKLMGPIIDELTEDYKNKDIKILPAACVLLWFIIVISVHPSKL